MSLEKIIFMKLQRKEFAASVELSKRDSVNSNEGPGYSLFETAKNQLSRSASKNFGFFDNQGEHKQLQGLLKSYQENSIDFASFANKAGEQLQIQLELSETPFTAVLLFAQETILGQEHIYILWLPTSEVIQTGPNLEPYTSEIIEPNKVQYALRLNLDEWDDDESNKYLTILSSRGTKDIAEAFLRFNNFSEGIDTKKQTTEFLDIIDAYGKELDEEQSKEMKTIVIDYCVDQDKIGSPVALDEVSELVSQNEPTKFIEYVHTKQEQPQAELHTDRAALRKYMRFSGRDNSLSISFSAGRYGDDITYDPASDSLIIKKLPKNLKSQFSRYGNKQSDE